MVVRELRVYQLACEVGDLVWELVSNWDSFPKWTMGKQLVEAADSIAANIVEADGRYFYGEKRKFLYYARGSSDETRLWLERSFKRGLILENDYRKIAKLLDNLAPQLNNFIKTIERAQNEATK